MVATAVPGGLDLGTRRGRDRGVTVSDEFVRRVRTHPDVLEYCTISGPGAPHVWAVPGPDADPVELQCELSRIPGGTVRLIRRIPRLPNRDLDAAALPAP